MNQTAICWHILTAMGRESVLVLPKMLETFIDRQKVVLEATSVVKWIILSLTEFILFDIPFRNSLE